MVWAAGQGQPNPTERPPHADRAQRFSELTNEQTDTFIHGVFDDVTDSWRHAVNAVHVVIGEFLVPRFRQAMTP